MSDAPVSNDLSNLWPAANLTPTASVSSQQNGVPEPAARAEENRKRRHENTAAHGSNENENDDFATPPGDAPLHAIDRLA